MITENLIAVEALSEKAVSTRPRRRFFDLYARQWMSGLLMLTDALCLLVAGLLAVQLRGASTLRSLTSYEQIFVLLCIILFIKFYRTGLYPGIGLHYIDELRRLVTSLSVTFVILAAVTFILHTSLIYSRLVLLLTWLLSIGLIPFGRYLIRRFLIFLGLWGLPVVVIGDPQAAAALAKKLHINLQHGIRPELIVCPEDCLAEGPSGSPVRINACARRPDLQDAFVLVDDMNNLDRLVDRYRFIFMHVTLIKDQVGNYGLSNLKPQDFSSVLGLQVMNNLLSKSSQLIKRCIDLLVASIGLLLFSPFLGLLALAIQLDDPGRVFYRSARLGKGGRTLHLLKFRTMRLHAEEILKSELMRNPELKKEWDCYQKLAHDPRITRLGRFLRKYSLDELPQLWNILRGEMSLVGPRPILPAQRERYGNSYKDYIQVTPGMTGLWQVSGRNHTSFARRAELDNEYIQRWSIWMDFYILVKTIKVVLFHEGAS